MESGLGAFNELYSKYKYMVTITSLPIPTYHFYDRLSNTHCVCLCVSVCVCLCVVYRKHPLKDQRTSTSQRFLRLNIP